MSIEDKQTIVSRLYTDETYLNRFLASKECFFAEEQICDVETRSFLDALKPEQLRFFANNLRAKHYHETLRLIPLTHYVLEKDIKDRFREFSLNPGKYGIHRTHEEALAFLTFLQQSASQSTLLQSVLRFESAMIQHFLHPVAYKPVLFRYNVFDMLVALRLGNTPSVRKGFTLLIFRKDKPPKVFGLKA